MAVYLVIYCRRIEPGREGFPFRVIYFAGAGIQRFSCGKLTLKWELICEHSV